MHRRALHLAGFLLLLSSLGVAENSAARAGSYSLAARYISVLLANQDAAIATQTTLDSASIDPAAIELPATSLAQVNAAWTMRPPSAHSVSMHTFSGSSL